MVSVLKKLPLSQAVEAMTDMPMTHSVAPIWALREYRMTDAQKIAKAMVWLMKRKKKTKWMLRGLQTKGGGGRQREHPTRAKKPLPRSMLRHLGGACSLWSREDAFCVAYQSINNPVTHLTKFYRGRAIGRRRHL